MNCYRFTEVLIYTFAGWCCGINGTWWLLPLLVLGAFEFAKLDMRRYQHGR